MKDETKNLLSCIYKTSGHYYKTLFVCACFLAVISAIIYLLATVFTTLVPIIVSEATSLPIWVDVLIGIFVTPLLAATVICYVNRKNKEIEKSDKDFICSE